MFDCGDGNQNMSQKRKKMTIVGSRGIDVVETFNWFDRDDEKQKILWKRERWIEASWELQWSRPSSRDEPHCDYGGAAPRVESA